MPTDSTAEEIKLPQAEGLVVTLHSNSSKLKFAPFSRVYMQCLNRLRAENPIRRMTSWWGFVFEPTVDHNCRRTPPA